MASSHRACSSRCIRGSRTLRGKWNCAQGARKQTDTGHDCGLNHKISFKLMHMIYAGASAGNEPKLVPSTSQNILNQRQFRRSEHEVIQRFNVLLDLRWPAGADQDAGDRLETQNPRERHLSQ